MSVEPTAPDQSSGGLASWLSSAEGKKLLTIGAPLAVALGLLFAFTGHSQRPSVGATQTAFGQEFTPGQKAAIESTVKDYLLRNPEVMEEVLAALDKKKHDQEAEAMKQAVAQNSAALFKNPNATVVGNPKGDVTMVEFFDYNCGYCKRALGDIGQMIQADSKLKVIFKELPILSKGSEEASRVAIGARMQGKYWEFHKAMLEMQGQANEASSLKVAEKLGLDMVKLKQDMASPAVKKEIAEDRELADRMGINGTPHFLIGDKVIPGAPENLKDVIAGLVGDVRKNGCKVC